MNNSDLINQMTWTNQNLVNQSLYYATDETTRTMSNVEVIFFLGFTGFLVLFTIFTIWYSLKD